MIDHKEPIRPGKRKPSTGVDVLHSLIARIEALEHASHTEHNLSLTTEAVSQIVEMVLQELGRRLVPQPPSEQSANGEG